jgi:IclR family acetate operon transcriptional repressor
MAENAGCRPVRGAVGKRRRIAPRGSAHFSSHFIVDIAEWLVVKFLVFRRRKTNTREHATARSMPGWKGHKMSMPRLDYAPALAPNALAPTTLAAAPRRLPRPDRDLVQSLVRALELLEILSGRACRLTELAQRAKLPASTTHRLLTTMEQKRFVCFNREENLWSVSSHCYAIGSGFLRREALYTQAAPFLNNLASQLGAAANLGVLEGSRLIIVRQSVGCDRAPVQPPGASLPLHATAMGKVLLAESDSRLQLRGQTSGKLARLTERTICDPAALARELKQIKMRGFALDDEESLAGRRCLAAPVRDGLGQCVAAISITATPAMMGDGTIERLRGTLTALVTQVSRSISADERQTLDPSLPI